MPHESPEFDRSTNDDASRESFEQRIHALLDDRRAPEGDAWVQSQSELSQENRQLLVGQQLMLDGLELSEVPELPDDFAERCVAIATDSVATGSAKLQPPSGEANQHRFSTWRVTAYAATICLVFALIAAEPLWTWIQGKPLANAPAFQDDVAAQPDISQIVDGRDADLLPETLVLDEGPALESGPTPEDLYEMFRDLRERIPSTDGEENLLALRPQWVDDMATGLRPVADSVGGALNALRRNLPPTPKADGNEKPQAWLQQAEAARVS